MAAIAMETAKMLKNWKTQKWQTVSMATAAILKFQDLNVPVEMGIYLPVKFSKDRIINLWEFGRTISQREEEEEEE
jgi:aromatic ring-opening dioxygenase LigB subunit